MGWYNNIDLSKLSDEDRWRLIEYVVSKLGKQEAMKQLNISRITLWRLLNRKSCVDDEKLRKILQLISQDEFERLVGARKRLEALGIVRDGRVDYGLVLEILAVAKEDVYVKNAILRFVVQEFKEDLKKMLGISFAGIVLQWNDDFEQFLMERKKRRKVKDPETLKYYRSLFEKHLEGKELSEELIDYVVNHENKWLRNVFRHYIQYLYFKRRISPETFGWIMEVVPSRTYESKVRIFKIDLELLKRTMDFLREKHELYYLYYLLMYYSGIRLEHVVKLVGTYSPDEIVYVEMMDDYSARLVCFDKFCRYYLGYRGGKPCDWVYFPKELVELLEKYGGTRRGRAVVSKYALRNGLLRPKYLRKLHWQVGKKVIKDKDVVRFIQSRLGELKISEERYGDLLSEADVEYPRLMEVLSRGIEDVALLNELLTSKRPT